MATWPFHVLYPSFDVTEIPRYLNEFPPKWEEYIPKFDGDIHFIAQHVASFLNFVSRFNIVHEDVLIRLFVYS